MIYFLFHRPSFWAQRTRMEKRLLLAVGVISLIAVAFLAAFLATVLVKTSTDINGKCFYDFDVNDIKTPSFEVQCVITISKYMKNIYLTNLIIKL